MLNDDVERYLALRQSLGFKLEHQAPRLRAFARFAMAKGDTQLRAATAIEWTATASSRDQRQRRLGMVAQLGRFLQAEDRTHEVPPVGLFAAPRTRPSPYIYTREELICIVDAAGQLRASKLNALRPQTYMMLLGLLAATGLRVSEALNLKLGDLLPGGVLRIRETKFCKSRLVPLHETVVPSTAILRRGPALPRWMTMYSCRREDGRSPVTRPNLPSRAFCGLPTSRRGGRAGRASTISDTALRRVCWSDAPHGAMRSRATSLPWRPIWVTPMSLRPTGIFRRHRS